MKCAEGGTRRVQKSKTKTLNAPLVIHDNWNYLRLPGVYYDSALIRYFESQWYLFCCFDKKQLYERRDLDRTLYNSKTKNFRVIRYYSFHCNYNLFGVLELHSSNSHTNMRIECLVGGIASSRCSFNCCLICIITSSQRCVGLGPLVHPD